MCCCVWWPPDHPHGTLRNLTVAARLCARTLPHIHRSVPGDSIIHVEGGVASGALTALALLVAHGRGRSVVYSPHNTFSRRGRFDGLLLGACLFFTESSVAYSEIDVATLRSRGAHSTLSPLIQLVPEPAPERVARWRSAWSAAAGDEVVLFAGLVRAYKRLDVLVRAASDWPPNRRLAVVGQDRGELERCRALGRELGVELHAHDEFVPLDEFTAALAAADVVVAPYERASQSGVLSVASQLGTPTVASNVGGLAELADRTFPPGDSEALTRAIDAELADADRDRRRLSDAASLDAHRAAYAYAHASRSARAQRRRRRRPRVAFVAWGAVEGRAEEFAVELGGEHRTFFDFGIVDRRLIPLRYLLSALRTLAYLLRARPGSLIVANPPIFAAVICCAYARLARIPIALDSHPIAFGQKHNRVGRFFLPVHAALTRRVTTTLVGTEELANRVRAWGGQVDVVHEAPPPATAPDDRQPRSERPRVLWSGIFAADEPFMAVTEAARLLPDVELLVAGDLRRCPVDPATAPPNMRWLGFLRGEEYRATMRSADAVLALTDDSTSALRVAAEAVYACTPLVTSDLEHLQALFPNGVRVGNDAASIANGIRTALANGTNGAGPLREMRDVQLARWRDQKQVLLRRLELETVAA